MKVEKEGLRASRVVLLMLVLGFLTVGICYAAGKIEVFNSLRGSAVAIGKLEGHIGDEWKDAARTVLSVADGEMKVLIKHDQEYLYLAFDIDDNTKEDNDEIQIYLDTLHNRGKSFNQPDDRKYGVWRNGQIFGKNSWEAAVAESSRGWQLEGRASLSSLNSPQPGSTLGLRIYHRDTTKGVTIWPQGSYLPDTWGDLTLKKGEELPSLEDKAPADSVKNGDAMVLISAGEFLMGSSEGPGYERPAHKIHLDAYYIDKYEVTNAQFCEFLNEKGDQIALSEDYEKYQDPEDGTTVVVRPLALVYQRKEGGIPWLNMETRYCQIEYNDGEYQPMSGYENHPVVGVSWYAAKVYAEWAGKRLPTEAEWEKAARGDLEEKQYPWGDSIDSTKANYDENVGHTTPVDSYDPNDYGLYNMAGNVGEWCSDWYGKNYYAKSPAKNPQGPNSGSHRLVRGGSWQRSASNLRCAARMAYSPHTTDYDLGFRCAKSSLAQD